jgi:NADH-dependant formate dehydrogenase delta subunit FdsD
MNALQLVKMKSLPFGKTKPDRKMPRHLKRYWDPHMRKQIVEHYRAGERGLCDIARAGVGILANPQPPAPEAPLPTV